MWRQRLVSSLPYILVILSAAGVAITEEVWLAIGTLVGMWLLPTPLNTTSNVSRETSTSVTESVEPLDTTPCHYLHGPADAHVLGCEGWSKPLV